MRRKTCGAVIVMLGASGLLGAAGDAAVGPSAGNTMKGPTGEPIAVDVGCSPTAAWT